MAFPDDPVAPVRQGPPNSTFTPAPPSRQTPPNTGWTTAVPERQTPPDSAFSPSAPAAQQPPNSDFTPQEVEAQTPPDSEFSPSDPNPQVPPCSVDKGIVQNPDFDIPSVTGAQTFTVGQTIGAGWLVEFGSATVFEDGYNGWASIDGQSLLFDSDGSEIGQAVQTEVGKAYHLTFSLRARDGDSDAPTALVVKVQGGTTDLMNTWQSGAGPAGLMFVAGAAVTVITLTWPEGSADAFPVIDNVRIY